MKTPHPCKNTHTKLLISNSLDYIMNIYIRNLSYSDIIGVSKALFNNNNKKTL